MIAIKVFFGIQAWAMAFVLGTLLGAWILLRWGPSAMRHWLRLVILITFGVFLLRLFVGEVDSDEASELHTAWLVSQGAVPYRDFIQNHLPTWSLVLAAFLPDAPSAWTLLGARIACLALFVVAGVIGHRIAGLVWRDQYQIVTYLALLGSGLSYSNYHYCRPEALETPLLLAGLLCLIRGRHFDPKQAFTAGLFLGLAMTFTLKRAPVLVLAPVVFGWCRRHALFVPYLLGVLLGVSPLLAYLVHFSILSAFTEWVVHFNGRWVVADASFQLATTVCAVAGVARLLPLERSVENRPQVVAILAFILVSYASLTSITGGMHYYLSTWFVLGAILAAGLGPADSHAGTGPLRPLRALGLSVVAVLLVVSIQEHFEGILRHRLRRDLEGIDQMLAVCRGKGCVAIVPRHPIFCLDSTRVYSPWHVNNFGEDPMMVSALRKGLVQDLRQDPPALVQKAPFTRKGTSFLDDLVLRTFITAEEATELRALFARDYEVRVFHGREYYVRK